MAKKTVINDFSTLKGKLSFSEQSTIAKPEGKKPDHQEIKSEPTLKVGQKVVLMDSDLRGSIISLGKTVGIELEDGLVIQATYGEFAITSEEELSALRQSKVKVRKQSVTRKSTTENTSGSIRVDLHIEAIPGGGSIPKGLQLQAQMNIFRRIIWENLPHRGMTITFIHGIGDGILKAAIRKELDEVLALRCSYSVGDPAITIVTIK